MVFALALVEAVAGASSDYPDIIKTKLGLAKAPDCVLCHSDDKGGNGTIVTWVGLSMQDFGLQGKRPDVLDATLDRIAREEWDSDGDSLPDVEELRLGSDPNDGPGRTDGPPRPGRGCSLGGSPNAEGGAMVILLALAALARRSVASARGTRP
jgi:hypothetical protein